jgi:hypothetical protein
MVMTGGWFMTLFFPICPMGFMVKIWWEHIVGTLWEIPSGHFHRAVVYVDSPFIIHVPIRMVTFNSYVSIPEGNPIPILFTWHIVGWKIHYF